MWCFFSESIQNNWSITTRLKSGSDRQCRRMFWGVLGVFSRCKMGPKCGALLWKLWMFKTLRGRGSEFHRSNHTTGLAAQDCTSSDIHVWSVSSPVYKASQNWYYHWCVSVLNIHLALGNLSVICNKLQLNQSQRDIWPHHREAAGW